MKSLIKMDISPVVITRDYPGSFREFKFHLSTIQTGKDIEAPLQVTWSNGIPHQNELIERQIFYKWKEDVGDKLTNQQFVLEVEPDGIEYED